MRLVRLLALFGSLVLLVATSVSLVNHRSELRSDQNARVEAAASIAVTDVLASIDRSIDLIELTSDLAEPGAATAADLAARAGGDACVGSTAADCSGPDLYALDLVAELTGDSAATGRAVAAVDADADTLLAVSRSDSTIVLQVPIAELVSAQVDAEIDRLDATVDLTALGGRVESARSEPAVVDGRRIVNAVVAEPFVRGGLGIDAGVDGTIGLAGDAPVLFGALLALGTVLLALAGWTFLVERRSLERRATTDELTGLVNRREFERITNEELLIADRLGTGLCVMLIDLNGFKQINDSQGHQFGDLVLKGSAERLAGAVRDTDVVARWGGDEFVVLLPGLAERSAVRNLAERISHSLASAPIVGDTRISGSIGAAIFPRHGATLDELVSAADGAMYGAKSSGVGHRIADIVAPSAHDDDGDAGPSGDGYRGPERRRSPVPPPPAPPTHQRTEVHRPDTDWTAPLAAPTDGPHATPRSTLPPVTGPRPVDPGVPRSDERTGFTP